MELITELHRPCSVVAQCILSSCPSLVSRLLLVVVLCSSHSFACLIILSNMHSLVAFLSLFAAFVSLTVGQQCYGLDGSQLDNTFAPCNPSAKRSGCCATKRSTGADLCLDSGLCMSTSGENTGMIWQNGCTDPTGKDVGCPKICPSSML